MMGVPYAAGVPTPVTVMIGPGGTSTTQYNVTSKVDFTSLQVTETGNHESATCDFAWLDKTFSFPYNRGEWVITIQHGSSFIFRGFITHPRDEWVAIYGKRAVSAVDLGMLLDRLIIDPAPTPPKRSAAEGMKARISWLMYTYGQPLMALGLDISTYVQNLHAGNMPAQRFKDLTLRQALERILSAGDDTGTNYYLDYSPALHVFDDSHDESSLITASPYDINSNKTLQSSPKQEVAPEELSFEWDSSRLTNWYCARYAGIEETYTDQPSIQLFGKRMNYLDTPDAATTADRRKIAYAALRDTRNPIPQGRFVVSGSSVTNGAVRWQAGQTVYITSTAHGLNGRNADSGPWVTAGVNGVGSQTPLQPFRVVRLTTTYLDGAGHRRMEIECGGRRRHLFT